MPKKGFNPLREKLADYSHEAWSGWMKHMFGKSERRQDGSVLIPPGLVERWDRQMNTPYSELPENEAESDRQEADRMIKILTSHLVHEMMFKEE